MTEELTGVPVVIFISGGILTLIMLFIFVKRQIMRFALRSRRGPHVPVGHDTKKAFRREIERRLDVIPKVLYEPNLLPDDDPKYILPPTQNSIYPSSFYCRQRAVDDVKKLEMEITKYDKTLTKHPSENLRAYLLNTLGAPMNGVSQRTIHQFCDLYEQARYDPNEFTEEEYRMYSRILLKLLDAAKMLKGYSNVCKYSPSNRTPVKRMNAEKIAQNNMREVTGDQLNDEIKQHSSLHSNPDKNGETPV